MNFKHTLPIQLRFNDADSLGHINNSVYLNFYDLGKTSYFQAIFKRTMMPESIDVVVAHVDVDFVAPVFLNDTVEVQTTVSCIGTKSFTLLQRIIDTNTKDIKCICQTVMVGYDFTRNDSKPISDEWRNAIAEFEERDYSK